MTDTEKTKALLLQALCDDNLQIPGGCVYVDENGKRCIVSTVLHLAGADDQLLVGSDNQLEEEANYEEANCAPLRRRKDLISFSIKEGLNHFLLAEAQAVWDNVPSDWSEFQGLIDCAMEKVYYMAAH